MSEELSDEQFNQIAGAAKGDVEKKVESQKKELGELEPKSESDQLNEYKLGVLNNLCTDRSFNQGDTSLIDRYKDAVRGNISEGHEGNAEKIKKLVGKACLNLGIKDPKTSAKMGKPFQVRGREKNFLTQGEINLWLHAYINSNKSKFDTKKRVAEAFTEFLNKIQAIKSEQAGGVRKEDFRKVEDSAREKVAEPYEDTEKTRGLEPSSVNEDTRPGIKPMDLSGPHISDENKKTVLGEKETKKFEMSPLEEMICNTLERRALPNFEGELDSNRLRNQLKNINITDRNVGDFLENLKGNEEFTQDDFKELVSEVLRDYKQDAISKLAMGTAVANLGIFYKKDHFEAQNGLKFKNFDDVKKIVLAIASCICIGTNEKLVKMINNYNSSIDKIKNRAEAEATEKSEKKEIDKKNVIRTTEDKDRTKTKIKAKDKKTTRDKTGESEPSADKEKETTDEKKEPSAEEGKESSSKALVPVTKETHTRSEELQDLDELRRKLIHAKDDYVNMKTQLLGFIEAKVGKDWFRESVENKFNKYQNLNYDYRNSYIILGNEKANELKLKGVDKQAKIMSTILEGYELLAEGEINKHEKKFRGTLDWLYKRYLKTNWKKKAVFGVVLAGASMLTFGTGAGFYVALGSILARRSMGFVGAYEGIKGVQSVVERRKHAKGFKKMNVRFKEFSDIQNGIQENPEKITGDGDIDEVTNLTTDLQELLFAHKISESKGRPLLTQLEYKGYRDDLEKLYAFSLRDNVRVIVDDLSKVYVSSWQKEKKAKAWRLAGAAVFTGAVSHFLGRDISRLRAAKDLAKGVAGDQVSGGVSKGGADKLDSAKVPGDMEPKIPGAPAKSGIASIGEGLKLSAPEAPVLPGEIREVAEVFKETIKPNESPLHQARKAIHEYLRGTEKLDNFTRAERIKLESDLYERIKDKVFEGKTSFKAGDVGSAVSIDRVDVDAVVGHLQERFDAAPGFRDTLNQNLSKYVSNVDWSRYEDLRFDTDAGIKAVPAAAERVTASSLGEVARFDDIKIGTAEAQTLLDHSPIASVDPNLDSLNLKFMDGTALNASLHVPDSPIEATVHNGHNMIFTTGLGKTAEASFTGGSETTDLVLDELKNKGFISDASYSELPRSFRRMLKGMSEEQMLEFYNRIRGMSVEDFIKRYNRSFSYEGKIASWMKIHIAGRYMVTRYPATDFIRNVSMFEPV